MLTPAITRVICHPDIEEAIRGVIEPVQRGRIIVNNSADQHRGDSNLRR